jgi:cellulose 1,4-beta-cellobiosidase
VSPYVCVYSNDWYSQCLAGSQGQTTTSTTHTTTTTAHTTTTTGHTTTTSTHSTTSVHTTTTTGTHSTTTTSSGSVSTATGNPYVGATIYLIPEYVDEVKAAVALITDPTTAANAAKVESIPVFFWMDVAAKVPTLGTYLAAAAALGPNQLVQAVIYDLPDRDCAAYSSAGEYTIANNGATYYKAYIDAISAQVSRMCRITVSRIYANFVTLVYPSVRVVFVVEPDGLANLVTNMSVAKCANASTTYQVRLSLYDSRNRLIAFA